MIINMNKGAMFGLDARIALAIFGALSVISGASLYSAIQEAYVVSYNTQMKEVVKAIEHYRLSKGEDITVGKFGSVDLSELINENYLSGTVESLAIINMSINGSNLRVQGTAIAERTGNSLSNSSMCSAETPNPDCKIAVCMLDQKPSEYTKYTDLKEQLDPGKDWDEGTLQIIQPSNNTLNVDLSGSDIKICYRELTPMFVYNQ